MELDLHNRSAPQSVFNAGICIDNLTWWFWVKAGMGFTVGAGCMYVVFGVIWFYLLTRIPELLFLRALVRL